MQEKQPLDSGQTKFIMEMIATHCPEQRIVTSEEYGDHEQAHGDDLNPPVHPEATEVAWYTLLNGKLSFREIQTAIEEFVLTEEFRSRKPREIIPADVVQTHKRLLRGETEL